MSRPLQAAINAAPDGLERVLQRRLFPMHLQAVDFTPYLSRRQLTSENQRGSMAEVHAEMLGTCNDQIIHSLSLGLSSFPTDGASRPFAIYDASRGRVLIDARLSLSLNEDHVQHMAGLLVQEVYSRLASSFKLGVNCSGSTAVHLMAQALTLAVPAAFAAAPPLWFCLLCPGERESPHQESPHRCPAVQSGTLFLCDKSHPLIGPASNPASQCFSA